MDTPRLNAKSVAVDLVNDAIRDACLNLGYAAGRSYQEKAIKEFIQGKDVFISPAHGRREIALLPPCQVFSTSSNLLSLAIIWLSRPAYVLL